VVSEGGITVYRSNRSDLPAWRVLALEVEQLFGAPMANNDNWVARLRRHIDRGTAWCASIAPLQEMVGGMWLSSTNADAVTIAWLAVRREARRRGVGSALVGQALAEAGGRTVRVVTFGEGHPMNEEADAARDLYRRLGFKQSREVLPIARDGTPRVVFSKNAPR
jgi:ribosomal protein S18 acetylase RimI-like enzyme